MNSRERVLCAINHEEPDRVPIFFGTSSPTTMHAAAYDRLKAYLGLHGETKLLATVFQYTHMDEEVMKRFGSDGRLIRPKPGPAALRKDISPTMLVDDWGVTWEKSPSAQYYTMTSAPLRDATIDELEKYPWPDMTHPSRFAGLAEEARRLHNDTPYAVVALGYLEIFDFGWMLRGMEQWFMDMAVDPEFAHALLRKVTDLMLGSVRCYMKEVGPYIDLITVSDDLGGQCGPLISPTMYRNMIKPYHAELLAAIKSQSKAKVFFHSCGDVYAILGDLVDIGVDVLNPAQVSAGDMADTARLKREFGRHLTFCGGVDTHHVLPHGTPDDVRAEVRRRIKDLAPGGGYILSAVHSIQPDVPPENVVAMLEEAVVSGRYPLQV